MQRLASSLRSGHGICAVRDSSSWNSAIVLVAGALPLRLNGNKKLPTGRRHEYKCLACPIRIVPWPQHSELTRLDCCGFFCLAYSTRCNTDSLLCQRWPLRPLCLHHSSSLSARVYVSGLLRRRHSSVISSLTVPEHPCLRRPRDHGTSRLRLVKHRCESGPPGVSWLDF